MNAQITNGSHGSATIFGAGSWIKSPTAPWARYIQFLSDTVVSTLMETRVEPRVGDVASITFPAGLMIEGQFEEIEIASGAVRIYFDT